MQRHDLPHDQLGQLIDPDDRENGDDLARAREPGRGLSGWLDRRRRTRGFRSGKRLGLAGHAACDPPSAATHRSHNPSVSGLDEMVSTVRQHRAHL